ncbi:putative NSF attachment protein [Helianthus debilis subsp. tardiflorus]
MLYITFSLFKHEYNEHEHALFVFVRFIYKYKQAYVNVYAFLPNSRNFTVDQAGAVYVKLAECFFKIANTKQLMLLPMQVIAIRKRTPHVSIFSIKFHPRHSLKGCLSSYHRVLCKMHNLSGAITRFFMEIGRLGMSARYCKEQNLEKAMVYYDKAVDLYQGEEVNSYANQCRLKNAQYAAELEQYQKAIEIYENIAKQALNNNLLKR